MEVVLVTFRREFCGLPYLVHCEDTPVSDEDIAWLHAHVFDPRDPIVDLSPDRGGPPELFRSLYLDGNFLTEISAVLEPEAESDPAALARHWRVAAGPAGPLRARALRAPAPPLVRGEV